MNTYSTTQGNNLTAIIGVGVLVLQHFKINIGSEEISTLVGAVMAAIGILLNWYKRYKQGDLTLGGFRRN